MESDYQTVILDGIDVAFIDHGGDGPGAPMVLIHGIAGSTAHWAAVGPTLARHRRVLALDLAGYGLTDPAGRPATLWANQRLVDRFIERVAGGRAIVVGSSMGGLVALLQAARSPDRVARLVLVDPAGPQTLERTLRTGQLLAVAPLLTPWLGERLALRQIRNHSPEHRVRRILKAISVDHHRVDPAVERAWIEVARRQRGETFPAAGLVQTLRSVLRLFWMPTYRAVVDAVRAPTLVLHGEGDPIVPLSASRWLVDRRPDWTLQVLPDAGHAPQMERPRLFVEAVDRWLGPSI